jgi:hypothetical protein
MWPVTDASTTRFYNALFAWLISQPYFSLTTNQPPATSQQYFYLRTNQPSATSQTIRPQTVSIVPWARGTM